MNLAEQNDFLRRHITGPCCVLTAGVAASPDRKLILTAVRKFNDFHEDSVLGNEHDFAEFEINGNLYFFKWEYYDAKFERRPKEGEERFHVLTIGLMSEY